MVLRGSNKKIAKKKFTFSGVAWQLENVSFVSTNLQRETGLRDIIFAAFPHLSIIHHVGPELPYSSLTLKTENWNHKAISEERMPWKTFLYLFLIACLLGTSINFLITALTEVFTLKLVALLKIKRLIRIRCICKIWRPHFKNLSSEYHINLGVSFKFGPSLPGKREFTSALRQANWIDITWTELCVLLWLHINCLLIF